MSAGRSRPDLFSFSRPFFHEVVKLKPTLVSAEPAGEPADIAARVRAIQQSLLTLLRGDIAAEGAADDARHLLAIFADEVLTSIAWAGRDLWRAEPLEAALFPGAGGAAAAFARLDTLLQRQHPADVPLATVYLAALALGLTGRSRPNDPGLRRYKEELAFFLSRHDPTPAPYSRHLFPDAYAHTARGAAATAAGSPTRRWPWLAAAAAALLLLLSHGVWVSLTHDLSLMTERILGAQ